MPEDVERRMAAMEKELSDLRRFALAVTQGNAADREQLGARMAHEVSVLTVLAQVCINLGVPTEQARAWVNTVGSAKGTDDITTPTEELIQTLKLSGSPPAGRA